MGQVVHFVGVTTMFRAGRIDPEGNCYTREALESAAALAQHIVVYEETGKTAVAEIKRLDIDEDGNLFGAVRVRHENTPLLGSCCLAASIKSLEVALRTHKGKEYILHKRILFLSFRVCPGEQP